MINYRVIVDAIPKKELDDCMVELAIEHPLIKRKFKLNKKNRLMPVLNDDGNQETEPVLDNQGNAKSANGKFMKLGTVEAAFNAIKDLEGFRGLELGYVQNALQKRAAGVI